MATARSRQGDRRASDRRHVGVTVPRRVKDGLLASAELLDWSAGDWVLAVAAEQGPKLCEVLEGRPVRRRAGLQDPTFAALYLTAEEREELDDQARVCGLSRSAFVTAVADLGLGTAYDEVIADVTGANSVGPAGRTGA